MERELDIYQKLGKEIGFVSIFTYGKREDSLVNGFSNLGVINRLKILPEKIRFPKNLNKFIYYLNDFHSLVFRYSKFKEIDVVKTNQFSASLLGILINYFFKKRLIVWMVFIMDILIINHG